MGSIVVVMLFKIFGLQQCIEMIGSRQWEQAKYVINSGHIKKIRISRGKENVDYNIMFP